MQLSEIRSTVKNAVRRPDLDRLIDLRILAAISACHAHANCIRDRIEFILPVIDGPAVTGEALNDPDIRTVETVTALDAQGNVISELERCSPSELLKRRRLGTSNGTYYVAGTRFAFQSTQAVSNLLVTAFVNEIRPSELYVAGAMVDLDDLDAYQTWLMQEYPIAIIDYAIGHCELLRGNTELAGYHMRLWESTHSQYIENQAAGTAGQ